MPKFYIAYHGGDKSMSPEDGAAHRAKWGDWLKGLGDAAISPANPLSNSKTVSASGVTDGGAPDDMSGFTIVRADDMDAALEIAQACPFLEIGGTLHVAQIMEMPGG